MRSLSTLLCGFMFGSGLCLAGMTHPEKVLAFLDVAGSWDPTLAVVMAVAVAVSASAFPAILRRPHPLLGRDYDLPHRESLDFRLLGGAALFGIGWGLTGYCPGPALVSLVTLSPAVVAFVACLILGMSLAKTTLCERHPVRDSQPKRTRT